nr:11838_t:CDS:2 [Entrophospora candida]
MFTTANVVILLDYLLTSQSDLTSELNCDVSLDDESNYDVGPDYKTEVDDTQLEPGIATDNIAVIEQHDNKFFSLSSFLSTINTNMLQFIKSIQSFKLSSSDNTEKIEAIKSPLLSENTENLSEKIKAIKSSSSSDNTEELKTIESSYLSNENECNGNDYSSSCQSLLSAIDTDILQVIVLLSLKNIEEFKASYSKKDLNCSSIDFSSNEKECLSNENGNSNDNSSVIELPQSHCYQQSTLTHLKSLNHYL